MADQSLVKSLIPCRSGTFDAKRAHLRKADHTNLFCLACLVKTQSGEDISVKIVSILLTSVTESVALHPLYHEYCAHGSWHENVIREHAITALSLAKL